MLPYFSTAKMKVKLKKIYLPQRPIFTSSSPWKYDFGKEKYTISQSRTGYEQSLQQTPSISGKPMNARKTVLVRDLDNWEDEYFEDMNIPPILRDTKGIQPVELETFAEVVAQNLRQMKIDGQLTGENLSNRFPFIHDYFIPRARLDLDYAAKSIGYKGEEPFNSFEMQAVQFREKRHKEGTFVNRQMFWESQDGTFLIDEGENEWVLEVQVITRNELLNSDYIIGAIEDSDGFELPHASNLLLVLSEIKLNDLTTNWQEETSGASFDNGGTILEIPLSRLRHLFLALVEANQTGDGLFYNPDEDKFRPPYAGVLSQDQIIEYIKETIEEFFWDDDYQIWVDYRNVYGDWDQIPSDMLGDYPTIITPL